MLPRGSGERNEYDKRGCLIKNSRKSMKKREKESKSITDSEFLMRSPFWGRTDLEQKSPISTRRRTRVRREGESGDRKGNRIKRRKNVSFSTLNQIKSRRCQRELHCESSITPFSFSVMPKCDSPFCVRFPLLIGCPRCWYRSRTPRTYCGGSPRRRSRRSRYGRICRCNAR